MVTVALGLDLGTTSIAAVAVSAEGEVVAGAGRPNSAAVEGLPPGHAEQDPEKLRSRCLEVLRKLAEALPETPHCLGITGQMHGVLLTDAENRPLTNLITWQDRRANAAVAPGQPSFLETYLSHCEPESLSDTGCRPAPGYLAVTLFVLQQTGLIPAEARRALLAADWMAAVLCECAPLTDRSNAASTGVYDLRRDRWSTPLMAAGGLEESLFPPVGESGAVLGGLAPEIAEQIGLPAGLPVCLGIGDNQAAVLGSVPSGEPAIQINVGTGGQINWPIDDFTRVEGMDTRYLPHGRFMLVGAGLAGGDAFAWVNRTAEEWLKALGVEVSREEIYRRMQEAAAELPADNDGLVCEPLFRGTRSRPQARGSFSGVSERNFTLGHVTRGVLEGIAAGMLSFYENAGPARPEHLGRIIGSGNGLRKNRLLVETLQRLFDRPVLFPAHREEAAFGAALLAGSQTGLWPDLETAGGAIRLEPAGVRD